MENEARDRPSGNELKPELGPPEQSAATRMTMFGLRRAVIKRNLLSTGRQTCISMPSCLMNKPSIIR